MSEVSDGGLRRRAAMHAALADPARLRITDVLTDGDASPSELAGRTGQPRHAPRPARGRLLNGRSPGTASEGAADPRPRGGRALRSGRENPSVSTSVASLWPCGPPFQMIGRVNERVPKVRAELELDRKAGAPQGVLTAEDGRRLPFSGWTELAAVIEEWRSGANRTTHNTREEVDADGEIRT